MNLRGSEYSVAVTATPGAIRAGALAYAYAATGTVRANAYIFEMLSAVRHISLSMVAVSPAQESGLDAWVPPRSRIFRALRWWRRLGIVLAVQPQPLNDLDSVLLVFIRVGIRSFEECR